MTLSRTARILIAALLVAAAAFFWVNFFNQDGLQSPVISQPSGVATPLAGTQPSAVTVPEANADGATETPAGAVALADDATPAADGDATAAGISVADGVTVAPNATVDDAAAGVGTADGVSLADGVSAADGVSVANVVVPSDDAATQVAPVVVDTAPPVVVTGAPTVVTRDLVVEDLPFLVTSPPTADAAQAEADAAGADRPQLSQRSNINPFSPIIVQAPPAAPSQNVVAQQVPESQPIIDIVTDANGQPVTTTTTSSTPTSSGAAVATSQTPTATQPTAPAVVRAPAPRAVAPASSTVSSLPRPIPSGTLPTTPEILRDARSQTSTTTPTLPDVGTLAALRVPEENQPLELATADGEIPRDGVVTPELLGPDRPDTSSTASRAPEVPLAVGADLLSRYLRDNNVTFTGTVLGPLSVGVFRSNLYGSPVVLTLGQTLPDTDILLTDLRGYEARFSLGERTQTLALDLRR